MDNLEGFDPVITDDTNIVEPSASIDDENIDITPEDDTDITPEGFVIDGKDYGDIENYLTDENKINDFEALNLANSSDDKFVIIASLIPYDGKSEVVAKITIPQDDGKLYISVFNGLDDNEIESLKDANFESLSDIYFSMDKGEVNEAPTIEDEPTTDDEQKVDDDTEPQIVEDEPDEEI